MAFLHVADVLQQQQLWICADSKLTRRAWLLLLTWLHEQEAAEDTYVTGDVSFAQKHVHTCTGKLSKALYCCGLTGTGSTSKLLLPVLPLSFLTRRAVSSTSTGSAGFSPSTCSDQVTCCKLLCLLWRANTAVRSPHLDKKLDKVIMQRPSSCCTCLLYQRQRFLHLAVAGHFT